MRSCYITIIRTLEYRVTLTGCKSEEEVTKTVHSMDKVEELVRLWLLEGKVA